MDNSISSQRFVTPAFGPEAVNANESAKGATAPAMQLLRSVALEEKQHNAVSALKASTAEKTAVASTLPRFADEQKQNIEGAYQFGLNRVAKPEASLAHRVPLGLMEAVEALTDELQKVSPSPIRGSGSTIHLATDPGLL